MIRLQAFIQRPFVRNVLTVASGTAASQAIVMAFAPFITRLYGPDAYGLQGLFVSVVGLLSTVAAFSYPTAIVLPKSDADALGIARLSIFIGLIMSLLTAAMLIFVGDELLHLLNAEAISSFVVLIPIAMMVSVLGAVLSQWLIRKKAFSLTARYAVGTSFLLNSVKTGFGILHPSALALIVINLVGALIGTTLTYFGWRKSVIEKEAKEGATAPATLNELAHRHRDFPLLRTPQNLINAFSQSLPVLLLAAYFGPGSSGQYSLALTVLGVPAALIGGSVMSVFYPRINEALRTGEDSMKLIIRATTAMAATGALPFLIVMIGGPFVFQTIFGDEWRIAGIYSQWLAIWIFFQYINRPAVSAIPALRLQGGLLIYELFSTGTKIAALWIGFVFYRDAVIAVAMFSIVGSLAYVWLILWVIRNSRVASRINSTQR